MADNLRATFHNGSYTDNDIVDVFAQRLTTPFNIYKNVNIPVGVYTGRGTSSPTGPRRIAD